MKFVITSAFGALEEIRSGVNHKGIDLAMPIGTKLRSISEGIVEKVTHYGPSSIGNGVVIRTNNGTRLIYGHMDKVTVMPGEHIDKGELLGTSGNSGFSTGPHLHFGLWKDGEYRDPTTVIEKVDAMAGGHPRLFENSGFLTDIIANQVREHAKEKSEDVILGILDAIKDIALDVESTVLLLCSGILVILRAVGFKHPWIRPGVLVTLHVLIRFLLGGFTA